MGEKRKWCCLFILLGNMYYIFVEYVVEVYLFFFLLLLGIVFDMVGDVVVDGGEVGFLFFMVVRSLLVCVSVVWCRIFIGGNLFECVGVGGVFVCRGSVSVRRGVGVFIRMI